MKQMRFYLRWVFFHLFPSIAAVVLYQLYGGQYCEFLTIYAMGAENLSGVVVGLMEGTAKVISFLLFLLIFLLAVRLLLSPFGKRLHRVIEIIRISIFAVTGAGILSLIVAWVIGWQTFAYFEYFGGLTLSLWALLGIFLSVLLANIKPKWRPFALIAGGIFLSFAVWWFVISCESFPWPAYNVFLFLTLLALCRITSALAFQREM